MSCKLLFPWIIVIQTIVLLVIIGTAYSSDNEAIESAVGPHLLHIVTISLLLITFINPSEDARSYAKIYAWTNVAMDNVALFLMLFRYSQTETLHLGTLDAAHFTLYVVFVLVLIVIDIHNITFSWDHGGPTAQKQTYASEKSTETQATSQETSETQETPETEVAPSRVTRYQEAAVWTPIHAPKLSVRNFVVPLHLGMTKRQHPSLRFV